VEVVGRPAQEACSLLVHYCVVVVTLEQKVLPLPFFNIMLCLHSRGFSFTTCQELAGTSESVIAVLSEQHVAHL
jgi:hypothetical protein